MPADSQLVRDWLKALGVLVASTVPVAEAQQKLAAYAPLLADEFPAEAFSRDSLAAVARQCEFFPAYGVLVGHLSRWWRQHRTDKLVAIAPPDHTLPDDAVRQSWDDPESIQARVEDVGECPELMRLLGACVARNAPQHLGLIPIEAWPAWMRKAA